MSEQNNDPISHEHDGEVLVTISFMYHDLGDIADGEGSEVFYITQEEYRKVEEFYAAPWAHYIGVMINLHMPRIKSMVEEAVSDFAKDIFISEIQLYDPELDEYDDPVIIDLNETQTTPTAGDDDLPF